MAKIRADDLRIINNKLMESYQCVEKTIFLLESIDPANTLYCTQYAQLKDIRNKLCGVFFSLDDDVYGGEVQ